MEGRVELVKLVGGDGGAHRLDGVEVGASMGLRLGGVEASVLV